MTTFPVFVLFLLYACRVSGGALYCEQCFSNENLEDCNLRAEPVSCPEDQPVCRLFHYVSTKRTLITRMCTTEKNFNTLQLFCHRIRNPQHPLSKTSWCRVCQTDCLPAEEDSVKVARVDNA